MDHGILAWEIEDRPRDERGDRDETAKGFAGSMWVRLSSLHQQLGAVGAHQYQYVADADRDSGANHSVSCRPPKPHHHQPQSVDYLTIHSLTPVVDGPPREDTSKPHRRADGARSQADDGS